MHHAPAARISSSRLAAVRAGAQNIDPGLILNRRHHGRQVHHRADHDTLRQPCMTRPRAVGRGEKHALAGHRLRRVLGRRIAQVETRRICPPPRSPPSTTSLDGRLLAAASASSISRNGTTSLAPEASAWQIVVVARNKSITMTVLPASSRSVDNCCAQIVNTLRSRSLAVYAGSTLLVRKSLG